MKKIGNCTYVHKSNMKELNITLLIGINEILKQDFMREFDWQIIKIDHKNNAISFIESKDWDMAREPSVGNALRIDCNTGAIKKIKARGQIYHHKWMFVADNYIGFDVEESKNWSKKWQSVIPKGHASKIGYKKYWDDLLLAYGLDMK